MELADLDRWLKMARSGQHAGLLTASLATLLAGSIAVAQQALPSPVTPEREYSPNLALEYPDQVFFGDTHLHTSFSQDAGTIGNRLGPGCGL